MSYKQAFENNFNSMMVRLEGYFIIRHGSKVIQFQFHDGAIGSNNFFSAGDMVILISIP